MAIIADALKITPAASLTSAAATSQSVVQTTAGGTLILNVPGSNRLNGRRFYVAASGLMSTGAGTYTATIAPILYGDLSLATVTTKPLFTSTAGTLAYTGTVGASIPWSIKGWVEGDSTSATFTGAADSAVGVTYKIGTVYTAPVSAGSINFATEPPFKFALGVTVVGTLGATPKFTVSNFVLEED